MKKAMLLMGLIAGMGAVLFAQETALPRLAVVEFSTNVNTDKAKADAITVRNLVESQMVTTRKYEIITRNEIDQLLANQRIQVSSISSAENIGKLKLQNVNYIVTGSVDAMGDDYAVTVRVLDVFNGKFSHSDNDLMGGGSRDLYNGINGLMAKFVAGMSVGEGGAIVQGQARGTSKTYNVGDTGPAGGIVFYDKGFVSDGWRYLEAAPAETEFLIEWGADGRDIYGTETALGSGKRNTQLIVEALKQFGENNRAAQICAGMDINGFTDWFLPSEGELNFMYKNLGGNSRGSYWSSSQRSRNYVWVKSFISGKTEYEDKDLYQRVRAVRAF